jgi:hypothetical protein
MGIKEMKDSEDLKLEKKILYGEIFQNQQIVITSVEKRRLF